MTLHLALHKDLKAEADARRAALGGTRALIANEQFLALTDLLIETGAATPAQASRMLERLARNLQARADGRAQGDGIVYPSELQAHARWLSERALTVALRALLRACTKGPVPWALRPGKSSHPDGGPQRKIPVWAVGS